MPTLVTKNLDIQKEISQNAEPGYNVMGIDPGLSGAFAIIDAQTKSILNIFDTPTHKQHAGAKRKQSDASILFDLLFPIAPFIRFAAIENVHSMPGDGPVGAFSFGRDFGMILGVLAALKIKPVFITPCVWKAGLNLSSDKSQSISLAKKLFADDYFFRRKKDDGRAEAALIAVYASRVLGLWK